jgi:hypothetical protein
MTVKLLGIAAVALSLIAAPVTARPLNQMVGFSGLNDPSITQTGVPTATINPGTYAIGGQGSVNFTPGDFKVACIAPNGTIAFVDPANPGIVCTLDPNSIVKGALTETGYIEFIPHIKIPPMEIPFVFFKEIHLLPSILSPLTLLVSPAHYRVSDSSKTSRRSTSSLLTARCTLA